MKNKPAGAPANLITETILLLLILSAVATAQETKINILLMPVDWTTGASEFQQAANDITGEISKYVPANCPSALTTTIIDKNCLAAYSSSENSCSENSLRLIEKCARKNAENNYDIIIGLTNSDICGNTTTYSAGRGTIISETRNADTTIQELLKEIDLTQICSLGASQPNTLILSVDLSIQNGQVTENRIKVEKGNPTPYKRNGSYNLIITAANGEILYQKIVPNSVNQKIKYSENMDEIKLYSGDALIYSTKINACSINNICQPHETQYSCPQDCTTEKEDEVCNPIQDGACDTDCYPEIDIDCPTTTTTTTTTTTSTTIRTSYEDCRSPHKSTGCDNPSCEACVCKVNYFCCTDYWHQICVGIAENNCREQCPLQVTTTTTTTTTSSTTTTITSTTTSTTTTSAVQTTTTLLITSSTTSAQETTTSTTEETTASTTTTQPPSTEDCLTLHDSKGCNKPLCEECVCNIDSFCCQNNWDNTCISYTQNQCIQQCLQETSTTLLETTTTTTNPPTKQNTYTTQAPPETKQETQPFNLSILIIPAAAIIITALSLFLAPIIYAAVKPRHKPRIGGASSLQHRYSRPQATKTSSLGGMQTKKHKKEERRSGLRGL